MASEAFLLLVEDNQDDVDLTLHALRRSGVAARVEIARDGEEALSFLFARGAHAGRDAADLPQLVLLDINLPKRSGLEVLREIRSHPATRLLPVAMLSTSVEGRDVAASYGGGANSYVRKPVDFGDFVEATRQLGLYWLVLNEPPPNSGR